MEHASASDKRKACDICYTKKIKCDMAKPTCSNCVLYRTPCRTSLIRHRVASHRANAAAAKRKNLDESSKQESRESLEKRLALLEERLGRLDQNSAFVPFNANELPVRVQRNASPLPESISPTYTLPLRDEVIPLVEMFFTHVNPFIPLFDEKTFPKLLEDFYTQPTTSSDGGPGSSRKTLLGAIHVVLGLACRVPHSGSIALPSSKEEPMVETCMKNVESLLLHLANEEGLLGLQALLGLIYLYLSSRDAQPATMLIGTAVQMCCRLRLNDREENSKYSRPLKVQRERVFWITYTLDRDISLRYQTSPMLSEEYADIDVPDEVFVFPMDMAYSPGHKITHFDVFRARIQLSTIQGRIYEQMYSRRAQSQKMNERDQRLSQFMLEVDLETWRQSLPTALQAENLGSFAENHINIEGADGISGLLTQLAELHFAYLSCLIRIHGVYSHDADWQRLLNSFQRHTVRECGLQGSMCGTQLPPLQQQWDKCVKASRDGLRLSQSVPLNGSNIWSIGCAYVSGLIVVLASLLFCDDLAQLEEDEALVQQGFVIFEKLRELSGLQALHQLHRIALALEQRAAEHIAMKRLLMQDFVTSELSVAIDIPVFGQV